MSFKGDVFMDYTGIKTVVERVVYYAKSTKWGVLSVRNTLENDKIFQDKSITLTGNFDEVYAGAEIIFDGNIVSNPKFGFQIELASLVINKDIREKESIINFLVKSAIKGISVQNACKIYNEFGEKSIQVVLHDTEKIKDIKGIGEETYKLVKDSVAAYISMEELINFGVKLGLPFSTLYKLNLALGDKVLDIIKTNVYSIIELTDELSFNAVDEIALKIGTKPDDTNRLRAAMIYCVKTHVMMSSSTGLSISELKKIFQRVTGVHSLGAYNSAINSLINENLVVVDGTYVYWKYYYDKEHFIATTLKLLKNVPLAKSIDENVIARALNKFPFKLNEQQVDAVRGALESRIAVITGGPGTGKSTITKAIVDVLKDTGVTFELLSPTGKATRRIMECTNYPAHTIHKYLHAKSANLDDIELPILPKDSVIIIDESSMVDILMMSKLVDIARISPIRFILIGDINQLPSIQVGNVLSDIISSGIADVFTLTNIMRQADGSHIVESCFDINKGTIIKQCDYPDMSYIEFYDENDLIDELSENYISEVQRHGIDNVQVITPYKKGALGTLALNNKLRELYNNNPIGDLGYAKGDKVMQVRNDYGSNVFNGETGIVESVVEGGVYIKFPRQEDTDFAQTSILYDERNLSDITLSYVTTCHKSQGAEFPVVFVVLDDSNGNFLLTRKLLYTAVSRGKSKVYIYSMAGCVSKCTRNTYDVERVTKLLSLLQSDTDISFDINLDELEEIPF